MVDDNRGDIDLAIEALHESKVANRLHGVETGMEALAFLRRAAGYSEAPRPDLILLDLNLPRKSGVEVLAEVKSDPELSRIPVVVLTTSPAERQSLLRTYNLPAASYILKPLNWTRFLDAVRCYDELELLIVKSE